MLFSKPKKAVGIDIGSHSIKIVEMSRHGGAPRVDQVGYAVVDRNRFNIDPLAAQVDALSEALRLVNLSQALVVAALPANTVVIRYPRLADMPPDQLAQAVQAEAGQSIPYELSEVTLDWTLLRPETEGETTQLKILLVAAKNDVIARRVELAQEAGIQYSILSVDSLALADAAECCDMLGPDESVALVNMGAASTSIHFCKDGTSNFIRDVNWGARELIQAIAKSRRCEYDHAENILMRAVDGLDEAEAKPAAASSGMPEIEPLGGLDDAGAAHKPPSGGGLLDPLDDELGDIGGAPPPPPPKRAPMGGAVAGGAEMSVREILATPLARLVSEIRRSFDFYEHQLYERPVSRVILSGGVASLPLLRDTLADELGIDEVLVADPAQSALRLGPEHNIAPLMRQPAQFVVAVGLAARGVHEL